VKAIAYLFAVILGLLGLVAIFAAAQANFVPRLVAGIVCLGASAALILLARMQPVQHTHVHEMKLDVPGDVSLQQIQCKQCGAELTSEAVTMSEGALFVKCQYCGSEYQMEEEAKW
jgi:DNA-directed RNA polymerase subunit RPC12/RpoP